MSQITKEELNELIVNTNKEAIDLVGQEWTESIEKQLDERIAEALKDFNKKRPELDADEREDPQGGYKTFTQFAVDVYRAGSGGRDESADLKSWNTKCISKAASSTTQSMGEAEAGGYLIPPEHSTKLMETAIKRSDIMADCTKVPMSTNAIDMPFINVFDESQGAVAGGVKFQWKPEKSTATATEVEFKNVELRLRKCSGMAYVTNEMLKFSPVSIEPILNTGFNNALTKTLNNAILSGTGAGMPKGILNSDCLVSVAKETEQAADTIVYENIVNAYARFYGDNGKWYANRNVFPQLATMALDVGAGGSTVYLPANAAAGVPYKSLMGDPIEWCSECETVGDLGDIYYTDFSQYLVGQYSGGEGLETSVSIHLKFDYDQTAFKFTFFMDGQPWWPAAFQPEHGDSLSPFVAIAERA